MEYECGVGTCSASHSNSDSAPSFDKFNVSSVPESFFADDETILEINFVIDMLEQGLRTQSELDTAYSGWCYIIKSDMYHKLPYRTVNPNIFSSKSEFLCLMSK